MLIFFNIKLIKVFFSESESDSYLGMEGVVAKAVFVGS